MLSSSKVVGLMGVGAGLDTINITKLFIYLYPFLGERL